MSEQQAKTRSKSRPSGKSTSPPHSTILVQSLKWRCRHPAGPASLGPYASVSTPFLRSSACSRRVRARPCSDVARRCDGALTAGHQCHGGRYAFRREPLCAAHAWCASHGGLFTPLAFLILLPEASRTLYISGPRPA